MRAVSVRDCLRLWLSGLRRFVDSRLPYSFMEKRYLIIHNLSKMHDVIVSRACNSMRSVLLEIRQAMNFIDLK